MVSAHTGFEKQKDGLGHLFYLVLTAMKKPTDTVPFNTVSWHSS
jgi:hypothetical protein